jgi:hypothetical protein
MPADTEPTGWARTGLPAPPPATLLTLSGYRSRVSGARLAYHSVHPDVDTALLVRARRDVQRIVWQTDTVPADLTADTVVFVWLTAMSGSKGVHPFDVHVNGQRCFGFRSAADSTERSWVKGGCAGAELVFQATMADRFGDLFGWMWLRVPRRLLTPGRPLTLSVTGADHESNAWYMTFEHRLAMTPRVRQDPVLLRGAARGGEPALRVVVDNISGAREAVVEVEGRPPVRWPLVFGGNVRQVGAGGEVAPVNPRVVVRVDGTVRLDTTVRLVPVARRDVYLLPHSHNDIGYSDYQVEVERKQCRNLLEAADLIERTRDYPDEARYRWNVEILWPVEACLRGFAPADRERVLAAMRGGQIGLNALVAGVLSGLATPPQMARYLDDARRLRDSLQLPSYAAQISDIPGQAWGMVSALSQSGIRYFALGPNPFDRIGYTLSTWGDRPVWWLSQSGEDSVLLWVAGASYAAFHMAPMRIQGEKVLYNLMRRLDAHSYPYRIVQLPYTVDGDNGPNDATLPDYVRDWNARYVSPRLVISTHSQMFRQFEPRHGRQIPVVRGDFTGYWDDGVASSALETRLARNASDRLVQAEALWATRPGLGPFPSAVFDSAWRQVAMWDEHTWGAAASIETPDAPDVVAQWRYKQLFALRADTLSRSLLAQALGGTAAPVAGAFEVRNASSWDRTDLVLVPAALSRAGDRVVDARGRPALSQRLSTGELAVLARGVRALGVARFRVTAARDAPAGRARAAGWTLTNGVLTLVIDSTTGAVRSLTVGGRDLVDRTHRSGLAEYVYVLGRDSMAARGATNARVRVTEAGPLVAEVEVTADAPGARRVVTRIRLVDGLDRADIAVTVDKLPVREKEGVHLAFPFRVPGGQVRFDVADGIVRPDSDQLAGSARNFVSAQSWVDVSADSSGVTVAVVDAPLVEIGGLNAEQPWMQSLPPTQTFFSYVMNNYWHTNYKADQDGPVEFRYAVRPHGGFRADEAARFGRERREPLLVAEARGTTADAPRFTLVPGPVLVSGVRPLRRGDGVQLRLWNPTASAAPAAVLGTRLQVFRADGNEVRGAPVTTPLMLPPWGTVVVQVR